MKFWLAAAVFLLLFALSPLLMEFFEESGFWQGRGFRSQSALELNWQRLSLLDYKTGDVPSELKSYDGQVVKIPGFMVPLEDNLTKVSEFLLVPDPQSCIHMPPPPPNQMVMVKMQGGKEVPSAWRAIWVYGKLEIEDVESPYGKVSFALRGESIEPYDY